MHDTSFAHTGSPLHVVSSEQQGPDMHAAHAFDST